MEKAGSENSHINALAGNSIQLVSLTSEATLAKAFAEPHKSQKMWQRN